MSTSQDRPSEINTVVRLSWPTWFPPVYVHSYWRTRDPTRAPCLSAHPGFADAKDGSLTAAVDVAEEFLNEFAIGEISGCLCGKETFVVAPMKPPESNSNALAYAFATLIARELDIAVGKGIYQVLRAKRDLQDSWKRLANPAIFRGTVKPNCDYILADDIYTLGGTFCGLRTLIESQGSRVICITALASSKIGSEPIALDNVTLRALRSKHGSQLDDMLNGELGYGIEQLTQREARFLLNERSVDRIRANLVRARRRSHAKRD